MSREVELSKNQMKRTPKCEKLLSYEGFGYGVEARVETCNAHFVRLILLENRELVLTLRFYIIGTQEQAVKSALQNAKNYYSTNESRLMHVYQQQPLALAS